jgi:hypothetical protein
MQRRRWLKLGLASAAVLAITGGSMALMRPGLDGSRLSAAGREVFNAVGRAILDGTLPDAAPERDRAASGMLERIDGLIGGLPDHARAELSQLLALLASGPGRIALAGVSQSWPEAGIAEVQRGLESMRMSKIILRQQAYHALHDIVGGAYFSDSTTWKLIGYPGPTAI